MEISNKESFVHLFNELFLKGELLKAGKLVNHCVPLELEEDDDIVSLRLTHNKRINDIRSWYRFGKPSSDAEPKRFFMVRRIL